MCPRRIIDTATDSPLGYDGVCNILNKEKIVLFTVFITHIHGTVPE